MLSFWFSVYSKLEMASVPAALPWCAGRTTAASLYAALPVLIATPYSGVIRGGACSMCSRTSGSPSRPMRNT